MNHVRRAWYAMSEDSPNATPEPRSVWLVVTDQFVEERNQDGSSSQTRLVARRSQTRRLVAAAQERAESGRRVAVGQPSGP